MSPSNPLTREARIAALRERWTQLGAARADLQFLISDLFDLLSDAPAERAEPEPNMWNLAKSIAAAVDEHDEYDGPIVTYDPSAALAGEGPRAEVARDIPALVETMHLVADRLARVGECEFAEAIHASALMHESQAKLITAQAEAIARLTRERDEARADTWRAAAEVIMNDGYAGRTFHASAIECERRGSALAAPRVPDPQGLVERIRTALDEQVDALKHLPYEVACSKQQIHAIEALQLRMHSELDAVAALRAPVAPAEITLDTLRRCDRCQSADLVFDGRGYKCVACGAYHADAVAPPREERDPDKQPDTDLPLYWWVRRLKSHIQEYWDGPVWGPQAVKMADDILARIPGGVTQDMSLEGDDERVARLVAAVRGAYPVSYGAGRPVFTQAMIDVESVVRFILLRASAPLAEGERPTPVAPAEMPKDGRGFLRPAPIPVTRGGEVRVHESSAAVCEGDEVQSGYLWMHVVDVAHNNGQRVEASAHLSYEQATEIANTLLALVQQAIWRREGR